MEYLMFPTKSCFISQTEGVDRQGNTLSYSYSHHGNKANDLCPSDGKLYAPCKIECIEHAMRPDGNGGTCGYISVFKSVNPVICADGTESIVTLFCLHGGENVDTCKSTPLRVGDVFEQNQHFYTHGGDDGYDANGNKKKDFEYHVHFNVKKGLYTGIIANPWYSLDGDSFISDIFFRTADTVLTWNNTKAYCTDYELTLLIEFDPSNKTDGLYEENGKLYYVANGQLVTGWKSVANNDYYFGEAGYAITNSWAMKQGNWCYLGNDGKKVVNNWIEDPLESDNWYHVDTNGNMETRLKQYTLPNSSDSTIYWFYFNPYKTDENYTNFLKR